jgi:hypothetical protein
LHRVVERHDLTPVLPGHRTVEGNRLETRGFDALAHAAFQHEELQGLDHRLDS